MFDSVIEAARRCAAVSATPYLDDVLAAYEAEKRDGAQHGPISLAVWGEFEVERKRRVAARG